MATARHSSGHQQSGSHRRDVFPALGLSIGGGALAGLVASLLIGEVTGKGPGSVDVPIAPSAALGAILGLFVGLGRAVWHLGAALELPQTLSPVDRLWDPWLDSGYDGERAQPETEVPPAPIDLTPPCHPPAVRFPAERARVRPRVVSPVTGEAVPLDDTVGSLIETGRYNFLGLVGGPGSGKTTALQHLAAVLPPWALARVRLIDGIADVADDFRPGDGEFVILASAVPTLTVGQAIYSLALWSKDDVIEYLLSAHWDQCASVMSRLKVADDRGFLKGIPELWTVVLDRMAIDETILDVRAAVRSVVAEWFDKNTRARVIVEDLCLTRVVNNDNSALNVSESVLADVIPERVMELTRLIRHRPVALLLAAAGIKNAAEGGHAASAFHWRFPHDLVQEAALVIAGNTLALQHLNHWLNRSELSEVQPMAASLLHAAVPGWRPGADCLPRLSGAYLARAAWRGVDLSGVNLEAADLNEAILERTNLIRARASRARFSRARIQGAVLNYAVAENADFTAADLRSVHAVSANFQGANLTGARLIEANLWKANLRDANIEDADFTGTNLEDARLTGLKLRWARFDYARFGGAELCECDLEEMVLTVPDFHGADLRGSLLTGSSMQEANFVGADLRGAGLAEIDWPGADLRDANLRDASFHLGSSRNGLVGSPIACEGSRTGFYTDDYHDQEIKPIEEIRKANLRGADLRGANIEGVDFYLVDLRDAKYTRMQAEHLRHCRAILKDTSG